MIPDYIIYHILPVNDLKEHLSVCRQNSLGIHSDCECEPVIGEEQGRYFIIHNSFDGREGVEWANELLNAE